MIERKRTEKSKVFFKTVFFCVLGFSIFICIYLTMIMKSGSHFNKDKTEYIESWTVVDQSGDSFEVGRKYDQRCVL